MKIISKPSTIQFAIFILGFLLWNNGIECFGQRKKDNSVTINENHVIYEVPMAYELMHIAMALTDTTIISNGYNVYAEIIDTNSNYYREVIEHFTSYKNHNLILKLNKALKKNASNYLYNQVYAYNSIYINKTVKKDKKIPLFHRIKYAFFSENRKTLQDFAKISKFEQFYNQHREYYSAILNEVQDNANVNDQQIWLEKEFTRKYGFYNIVISPLMHGTHFTKRFTQQGERKCIMWVAKFDESPRQSKSISAAIYTGIVMTEIDHNYVNPISDKYKKELNELMGSNNRGKWTNGSFSNSYKSGHKVFNEYMTHSVYLLYTSLKLNESDQKVIERSKIEGMESRRKFVKFGIFYEALKKLYLNRKSNETISDLYPQMIEWCKSENAK